MSATNDSTLLSVLLDHLDVPYTAQYTNKAYRTMQFKSVFGLTKLLSDYGISSKGYDMVHPACCTSLPVPFLVGLTDGTYAVATAVDPAHITIMHPDGTQEPLSVDDFAANATGKVLLVYPSADAIEPNYRRHCIEDAAQSVKPWLLVGSMLFILLYLVITEGVTHSLWTILLTLLDLGGLYVSYLLILKQMNIHSAAAEHVCGIIQQHGCSKVLASDGSSLLGLFHWAEVGMAYFSVTLIAQVAVPAAWPMLSLVNLCCLPFSVWSVWYQRTRAKAWCTLCLTIQSIFWLQFVCCLCGGLIARAWPPTSGILLLGAIYLAVLLLINRMTSYFGPAV